MKTTPRIAVSCGEPAGIGPDICLSLAKHPWPARLTVIGNTGVLTQRANQMGLSVTLDSGIAKATAKPGHLNVIDVPTSNAVVTGKLDPGNSRHVLSLIEKSVQGCLNGDFDAMVTAPVHKGVINDADIPFSGHTEFLAKQCGAPTPVMLLVADSLRVALVTTHLPLKEVPAAITPERLTNTLQVLFSDLTRLFGIKRPAIAVTGLNPHAGEGGHLGEEDSQVIEPTLAQLRGQGFNLLGPLPADTLFTPPILNQTDAVLAMYHDQGLPVLKYAGFGKAVNVTLGLPIIRTSVDHGTALNLAGTGHAESGSLSAAVELACQLSLQTHVNTPAT